MVSKIKPHCVFDPDTSKWCATCPHRGCSERFEHGQYSNCKRNAGRHINQTCHTLLPAQIQQNDPLKRSIAEIEREIAFKHSVADIQQDITKELKRRRKLARQAEKRLAGARTSAQPPTHEAAGALEQPADPARVWQRHGAAERDLLAECRRQPAARALAADDVSKHVLLSTFWAGDDCRSRIASASGLDLAIAAVAEVGGSTDHRDWACDGCLKMPAIAVFRDVEAEDARQPADENEASISPQIHFCGTCCVQRGKLGGKGMKTYPLLSEAALLHLRRVLRDADIEPMAEDCPELPTKLGLFSGKDASMPLAALLESLDTSMLRTLLGSTKERKELLADAAADLKSRYGQCNPDPRHNLDAMPPQLRVCAELQAGQRLREQTAKHQVPEALHHGLWEPRHLMLLLISLSTRSRWSGVHVDPTEAWNVAFAAPGTAKDDPVARWVFFHPEILDTLEQRMVEQEGWHPGWLWLHGKETRPASDIRFRVGHAYKDEPARITARAAQILQRHYGSERIRVVHQSVGDVVEVPPGFAHSVETLQPCVKVAWEVVRVGLIPLYLRNIARFGTRFNNAGKYRQSADYVQPARLWQRAFQSRLP